MVNILLYLLPDIHILKKKKKLRFNCFINFLIVVEANFKGVIS